MSSVDVLARWEPKSPVAQQLIDATVAVIDAEGEVAVRVQDIVAAVGVAIPVLYRHFGSRDGLIQAAQITRLRRDFDTEISRFEAFVEAIDSKEAFRQLVDSILDRAGEPERWLVRQRRINVLGSTYGRPDLRDAVGVKVAETIDRVAELFRRPQEQGWIRQDLDLHGFAAWFASFMLGRIVVELSPDPPYAAAYDELAKDAVRHVLYG